MEQAVEKTTGTVAVAGNTTEGRTVKLLRETKREGIEDLICYLEDDGFFESPASTKFHGCYPGGLAGHSQAVYDLLIIQFSLWPSIDKANSPGQKPYKVSRANLAIAALLHDVCKVGAYLGDSKPYKWNKQQPKGHAILSIERIKAHIALDPVEELMIRYHMGVYGLEEFYEPDSWEYRTNAEYRLRGDHSKCEGMSKEESKAARYGKSLRNAWYHNPICKLMYFCDEIANFDEREKEQK